MRDHIGLPILIEIGIDGKKGTIEEADDLPIRIAEIDGTSHDDQRPKSF